MTEFVVIVILAAWVAEAVLVGRWMARHGFDGRRWRSIALLFGPVAVVLGVVVVRRPRAEPRLVQAGEGRAGAVDILVGVDGSFESDAAVHLVGRLLTTTAGRVTLARVIPFDAPPEVEQDARTQLAAAAALDGRLRPATVVLEGAPAPALQEYARRLGYELIVVGARGSGKSRGPLGSVATALAGGGEVPVLLADDVGEARRRTGSAA